LDSADYAVFQAVFGTASLSARCQAGCFIGFNAGIDRKAVEQLASVCGQAISHGFDSITIGMTSIGGLLEQAYYAYGVLDALPIKIATHNLGSIQSSANMLFLCGDERYAIQGSTLFFSQDLLHRELRPYSSRTIARPPSSPQRQVAPLRKFANGRTRNRL
jgi:hypothetical protein